MPHGDGRTPPKADTTYVYNINATAALVLMYVFLVISLLSVAARTYARYFVQHLYTLSDLLTSLSFVFLAVDVALHTVMYAYGFWFDDIDFNPQTVVAGFLTNPHLETYLKMVYGQIVFLLTGLWCNKIGLCLLYYQLIPRQERFLMKCLHATTFFCVVSYAWCLCVNLFWCQPISRNWAFVDTCFVVFEPVPLYSTYALNLTTQLALLTLPFSLLRILYRSKTSPVNRRKLIAMGITFGLLSISIIMITANFAFLVGSATDSVVAILADLEQSVTIVIVCVPSFRFLFNRKWEEYKAYKAHVRKKMEEEEEADQLSSLSANDEMLQPPPQAKRRRTVVFALHDDGKNNLTANATTLSVRRPSAGVKLGTMSAGTAGLGGGNVRRLDEETGPGGLFQVGSGRSTPESLRGQEEEGKHRRRSSPKVTEENLLDLRDVEVSGSGVPQSRDFASALEGDISTLTLDREVSGSTPGNTA